MRELIRKLLFRPVDAASLALWRMGFGALLLFESVNYGAFLCLDCLYRDTDFLFKYRYFEWVQLPPGIGLELLFVVMAVTSVGVMLGWFYRVSIVLFTLCFSYMFLLDQSLYLNHFYLVILLCIIMVFVPAHRYWSIDARRNPQWASATVPNWGRFWLGAQLEIVLVYAGLVKLNGDWLNLEPMRLWMTTRSADEPAIFQWLTQDWGIALASYGVIALHLVGAPLLLWRRTRLVVFCLYGAFHVINTFVFNIGIFPWMTLFATLLLFDPDWPRQLMRFLNARGWLLKFQTVARPSQTVMADTSTGIIWKASLIAFVCAWLVIQLVVPWRHLAAPGDVSWNEDGHRFSWRMKLRSKRGTATFYVQRDDGRSWVVDPGTRLTRQQAAKMACIPDMLWQFAGFLEREYSTLGATSGAPPVDSPELDVQVYADTLCSLNAREPAPLVMRLVDLTTVSAETPVNEWTLPNRKPRHDPLW